GSGTPRVPPHDPRGSRKAGPVAAATRQEGEDGLRASAQDRDRSGLTVHRHPGTHCQGTRRQHSPDPRIACRHSTEDQMTELAPLDPPTLTKKENLPTGLFRKPRSPFLYMRYTLHGRQVRESTGCTTIKDAVKVYNAKQDEIAAARIGKTTIIGPVE